MTRSAGADGDKPGGEELDRLFSLPLERFTRARDELAARLRREGRRGAAEQVKKLRRPTAGAWALDQLARRHPERLHELLEAGEELRRAQERTLHGEPADALREASRRERALVAELTEEAASILERSGFSPSPANVEPVRATLSAAASAPGDDRFRLERGWLSRPLEPASFGALLDESSAPVAIPSPSESRKRTARAPGQPKAGNGAAPQARARAEERQRIAESRRAREHAGKEIEEAQREAERLERLAQDAEHEAERKLWGAEEAARTAAHARDLAEQAAGEASRRRAEAVAAEHRLREAKARLRALEP